MPAPVRVDLSAILDGPNSAVAVDLVRRLIRVESAAKRLCPVDSGRLRSSITHELVRSSGGVLIGRVGTNVKYARSVHDGHGEILPRKPGGVLRFPVRGGQVVYTRRVRPVAGVPFLRLALPAARG